jgi:pimeloyl-ACP methyl ester carboxylesterase
MNTITSKDGTAIAYERIGQGPPLILVDGALCSRAFGPMPKLTPLLAPHFTVFMYDRRGRGESGDAGAYAREREVEDIDALIQAAGGSAHLVGLSSGAALALEAAASGLNVVKLAAYEPPYMVGEYGGDVHAEHEATLKAMIVEDRRADAVKYFMRDMVGVPWIFVLLMRVMPGVWSKMKAVAHTLPYDAAVMSKFVVPTERLSRIDTPTVVMHGSKTEERLQKAAAAVAAAVPRAQHRTLDGQTHNVDPKVLTRALLEFFAH